MREKKNTFTIFSLRERWMILLNALKTATQTILTKVEVIAVAKKNVKEKEKSTDYKFNDSFVFLVNICLLLHNRISTKSFESNFFLHWIIVLSIFEMNGTFHFVPLIQLKMMLKLQYWYNRMWFLFSNRLYMLHLPKN